MAVSARASEDAIVVGVVSEERERKMRRKEGLRELYPTAEQGVLIMEH